MLKKITSNKKFNKVTLVLMASCLSVSSIAILSNGAIAADPLKLSASKNHTVAPKVHHDNFSVNTSINKKPTRKIAPNYGDAPNAVAAAGAHAMSSQRTPAVVWFEEVDVLVVEMRKTNAETVILSRNFNNDLERVQEWIKTAHDVSARYKYLAKRLNSKKCPEGHGDLDQYSKLLAQYYLDCASIYDDLTKPRPPSKTLDDLEETLASIESRSKTVKVTFQNLQNLDDSLRRKYRVHRNRHTDALQKYVRNR